MPAMCLPSLVSCLSLYLLIRPARPFVLPRPKTNWRLIFRVSGIYLILWLTGSIIGAAVLDDSVLTDHDIGGLEITMDNASGMSRRQSVRHLYTCLQRFVQPHSMARN